jgi:hypothetical protein
MDLFVTFKNIVDVAQDDDKKRRRRNHNPPYAD